MPEQPLPPPAERISLAEAAKLTEALGAKKSLKAIQQLVARGSLKHAKVMSPGAKRASRVVTTEAWVREYLEGARRLEPESEPSGAFVAPSWTHLTGPGESYWQALAERQAVEIVRLQARIAELEK